MSEQEWERQWWGDCVNTLGEERKQQVYAGFMGLVSVDAGGPGPVIDIENRDILDLGGGPVSLLLKCVNRGTCYVVDPCDFPQWVYSRYHAAGIVTWRREAEDGLFTVGARRKIYDECWIYNVLQHVRDPEQVIRTARQSSTTLRLFDWIDVPAHDGHPHELKREDLEEWIGASGDVHTIHEGGAVGRAFTYVGPWV